MTTTRMIPPEIGITLSAMWRENPRVRTIEPRDYEHQDAEVITRVATDVEPRFAGRGYLYVYTRGLRQEVEGAGYYRITPSGGGIRALSILLESDDPSDWIGRVLPRGFPTTLLH